VITASTGAVVFYSTYATARTAAGAGDLIQIWADLTDEQILLKDKVDIWIAPGRIIKTTNSEPLIVDNTGGYTTPVEMNITGYGIFINENDKYRCVAISNSGSKVSIECESLEGTGSDPNFDEWATVHIVNASKFYLKCDRIYNKTQKAIYFDNEVADININANIIENGTDDGGDLITKRGTGFLNANQVICNNDGSCLAHKAGNLTANILELINTTSESLSGTSGVVELSGGIGTQNLTLYFDEIENINTIGGDSVKAAEGVINLIGRRIYCASGMSMNLAANADILVNEIISDAKGINIHNGSTQKIIIDSNYIEGYINNDGVIKSASGSNYVLRNAKIKNTSTSGDSVCIYIDLGLVDNDQMIEIENLILVTGNTSTGETIFRDGTHTIDIKNLGLFVNKGIDRTKIILKIGTGTEPIDGNFKYIISSDIT
jgi:hypothetical protein